MTLSFSLYGGESPSRGLTLDELHALATAGDIWAHAENSGCEGCYVEVARYNAKKNTWERFACEKFFGGEDGLEPEGCVDTATRVAALINKAGDENANVVHRMENWI